MSIDIHGALQVGYKVIEYFELWHYPKGGSKFFRDFILNIVRRKIQCSGFPPTCSINEDRQRYIDELSMKSFVNTLVDCIKSDLAGCT